MFSKILGVLGVLWGGWILVNGLTTGPVEGSESYQMGRTLALAFGGVLLVVGGSLLFRKPKKKADTTLE